MIFTNYQFYVEAFARLGESSWARGARLLEAFVAPGNVITQRASRRRHRPAIAPERCRRCRPFISSSPATEALRMINIGTGPSNARTITDHVAVLRPHAWLMLGHCAGLRYRRNLAIMSSRTDMCVRITSSTGAAAVGADTGVGRDAGRAGGGGRRGHGLGGFELKRVMRTGTVASVDNRNWEIGDPAIVRRLRSRALLRSTWSSASYRRQRLSFPRALRHVAMRVR